MTIFEQALRFTLEKHTASKSSKPIYVGRAAFITLGDQLRARVEYVTTGTADKYEALQVTILNRTEGKVDSLLLRNQEIFAAQPISSASSDKKTPHIWQYSQKHEWYGTPTDADFKAMGTAVRNYLTVFAPDCF